MYIQKEADASVVPQNILWETVEKSSVSYKLKSKQKSNKKGENWISMIKIIQKWERTKTRLSNVSNELYSNVYSIEPLMKVDDEMKSIGTKLNAKHLHKLLFANDQLI